MSHQIITTTKNTNKMTTLTNLKNAITTQSELELISKEIWFMNFTKLIKAGFTVEFATKKATDISEMQINLLQSI